MVRKYLFKIICLIIGLAASSCEIDYESGSVLEDLDKDIPDYQITDLIQTNVKGDGHIIIIEASKAEDFRKMEEIRFYEMSLNEWDEKNTLIRTGQTDLGIIRDNNDAVMEGNITIYSDLEKTTVTGDYFEWVDDDKLLSGKEDGMVSLIEEEGSTVSGKGFVGDFGQNIVTFRSRVQGTITFSETNTEQENKSEQK